MSNTGTTTETLMPDARGIARAASLLRAGALVAFPTETVYGLGADARNGVAVAGIFAAKGRPRFNPLIVHVARVEETAPLAEFCPAALRLAAAFWPGPLTLVLQRRPESGLSKLVSAGLDTVALRVPAHPVAQALLQSAAMPVAAPSANRSGRVSPTTAAHVLEGLGGRIAAVVDGGPCPVGVESTILGLKDGRAVLLRPGGLTLEAIEAVLGASVLPHDPEAPAPGQAQSIPAPEQAEAIPAPGEAQAIPAPGEAQAIPLTVQAPGMLDSHYAPAARLRLDAAGAVPGEGWLGLGPVPAGVTGPALSLSVAGDLAEAAANLFAHLRALDAALGGQGVIAVGPVPPQGLGLAIRDRLRRAAAPR